MCRCDNCKLEAYPQKFSFEGWKRVVDEFVFAETGRQTKDMPDLPWWKMWHEGESTWSAVDMAKEDWGVA